MQAQTSASSSSPVAECASSSSLCSTFGFSATPITLVHSGGGLDAGESTAVVGDGGTASKEPQEMGTGSVGCFGSGTDSTLKMYTCRLKGHSSPPND